jgi:hypothetical protein
LILRSVSEDLENLLKDISGHYKRLLKANKPKAEEFRGDDENSLWR